MRWLKLWLRRRQFKPGWYLRKDYTWVAMRTGSLVHVLRAAKKRFPCANRIVITPEGPRYFHVVASYISDGYTAYPLNDV